MSVDREPMDCVMVVAVEVVFRSTGHQFDELSRASSISGKRPFLRAYPIVPVKGKTDADTRTTIS